jgi:tetratricopeptide (TPR) repeat protein
MTETAFPSHLAVLALLGLAGCQIGAAAPGPETAAGPGAAGPVVASDRAQAEAHYLLAQAEEAQGNLLAAAEGYEAALALDPWSRSIGADPVTGTPLAGLARICEGGGDLQAVVRACGAIAVSLSFESERLAAFQARRAEALLQLGEVDRARNEIKVAEQLDSGNPEVLLIRGRIEEASGEPETALRSLTLALFGRPGWPEAHLARGRLHAKLHDDTAALQDFNAVLSDPQGVEAYPEAYRDRAVVHCRLGEPEQTAVGWQVWAGLVPEGPGYLNELLAAGGYLTDSPAEGIESSALAAWIGDGCPGAEPRPDAPDSAAAEVADESAAEPAAELAEPANEPAAEPALEPAPEPAAGPEAAPAAEPAAPAAVIPGDSPADPAVNPG